MSEGFHLTAASLCECEHSSNSRQLTLYRALHGHVVVKRRENDRGRLVVRRFIMFSRVSQAQVNKEEIDELLEGSRITSGDPP